jgi:uncharacterized membrane protein YhaH (DUF805 family)
MAMVFCRACGAQMHETALVCPRCGAPAAWDPARQTGAQPSGWFGFRGRIPRRTYWLIYVVPIAAAGIVAQILDAAVFDARGIFALVVWLVTLVPSIAGAAKRCHDRDRTGWFQLILLIPLVGWIWLFIELGCLRGTIGPNRFGPDPLDETSFPSRAFAA